MNRKPYFSHPTKVAASYLRMTKYLLRRLQPIACLIPILVVWYYLLAEYPITFFQGTTSYFASPQRRTVTLFGNSHTGEWEQYLVFDTHSGRIRVEKNATLARNGVSCPEFVTSFSKDGNSYKKWRLRPVEQGAVRATKYWEFDFPSVATPRIVGHRYAVQVVAGAILVQDIYSANAITTSHRISYQNGGWIIPIGDANRFAVVQSIGPQPRTVSPQVAIELYEIGETGIPSRIDTWKARRGMDDTSSLSMTELGDQFIDIHPMDSNFEIRSTVDGSLIGTQPLPADFHALTDKWHLNRDALYVNRGARTFWITKSRWLNAPAGFLSYYENSPNHKLRLWSVGDVSTQVITDCDSDKEIARIDTGALGAFLDDETLVFASMQWGLAFREVDAKTGTTIQSWRPYWWVFPALWISVSAYVVWSIAWLRSTKESNPWAWLDIAWVISFPILTLAFRVKMVGDSLDIGRDPIFLLQGFYCALIFLAAIWGCNSYEWIVRKLLPMLLCFASLGTALFLVFNARIAIATNFILQALGFMAISIVGCLLLRVFGFHWSQASSHSLSERQKASLRDLFMLVLLSAALCAPMRLIVPDPMALDLSLIKWMPLGILVLAPSMAWATALSTNRYAHGFGKCVSILLVLYMLFGMTSYYCTGSRLLRFHNDWEGFAITFVSAFVATFVLSKAFRQLGCKL